MICLYHYPKILILQIINQNLSAQTFYRQIKYFLNQFLGHDKLPDLRKIVTINVHFGSNINICFYILYTINFKNILI